MVTKRYEIRLDPERRRKLSWLSQEQQAPAAEMVRQAIDYFYEEAQRERRHRAIEAICAMEIEDMPDPEELSRQLASTYDVNLP